MLGEQDVEALLKRVLALSEAPQTSVVINAADSYLTRFAQNHIHQNVGETNVNVMVRAVDGKRIGSASTTDLTDEGLRQAAETALRHARLQPESPDFPGLSEPRPVATIPAVDDLTAAYSPEARSKQVGVICARAAERKLNAFGAFATSITEVGVANSNGVNTYHAFTHANLQTVVMGDNGSGWAQASGWKAADIDADRLAQEAVEKALRTQNPHSIEPGHYTVVFDPYVTQDLIESLLFYGGGALAVQEGRSWMNERIGKAVFSSQVSLWDDGNDPSGIPMSFDVEGTPKQRVQAVKNGQIANPMYDRVTAQKEGKASTGHATPLELTQFTSDPLAVNVFMAGGDSSVEQMIQTTDKGLYVTRFWYTVLVHPRDCVMTGMTRDGVFMIEKGELTFPVKNLRFTQSYVEALANVEAVSQDARLLTGDGITSRVPALKISSFNFTGITV